MPKKRRTGKKKFTKKQLALIRRVLNLKGLPPQLRQMLLVLIGASMKIQKKRGGGGAAGSARRTKSSPRTHHKKRRATAKQLAVRRKFKAFIKKHGRSPRKGEHL